MQRFECVYTVAWSMSMTLCDKVSESQCVKCVTVIV